MTEQNPYYDLAEHDPELADAWDDCDRLPDVGENDVLDAFVARKHIDIASLIRVGARLSDYRVLAFSGPGYVKYRNMETGQRWQYGTFDQLRAVPSQTGDSDTAIVAEGETDAARLTMLYPEAVVFILPAGAKRLTQSMVDQVSSYPRVLATYDTNDTVGSDGKKAGDEGWKKFKAYVQHAIRFNPPGADDWCEYEGGAPPLPAALPVGPQFLDFAAGWANGDDEPDYLINGLLAVGEVMLISADTGAGKTWLAQALALAVVQGSEWLGRAVTAGRVLYVDEENPGRIPLARLRALGLRESDLPALRYFSRQGLQAGDGGANDSWIVGVLQEFNPSLVVLDTAMSATAIADINDNAAVVRLYNVLRSWAEKHECAVVLLHHERKQPAGASGSYDQSHAAMGARQMAGQADVQATLRGAGKERVLEGESVRLVTTIKVTLPKVRDDVSEEAEYARIESTKRGKKLLTASLVPCDPPVSDLAVRIAQVVRAADREMKTSEIAFALQQDADNKSFKTARSEAQAREWIAVAEGRKQGLYVAGPLSPSDAPTSDYEPSI